MSVPRNDIQAFSGVVLHAGHVPEDEHESELFMVHVPLSNPSGSESMRKSTSGVFAEQALTV